LETLWHLTLHQPIQEPTSSFMLTPSSTLTLRFSSFEKRKTKFFEHLYTSKVATKTYIYDSTMWCVRVCICYVGWQNTSYTVDTACNPSLSGLATAINRCTLSTSTLRNATTGYRLPLFSSKPGEPSKRSRAPREFPSERRLVDEDYRKEHWR